MEREKERVNARRGLKGGRGLEVRRLEAKGLEEGEVVRGKCTLEPHSENIRANLPIPRLRRLTNAFDL